jgi:hypothetical protein
MAYGTVKVDTIIFDQGGTDQNVTASGIYRAITSGVTVTGTISGAVLIGTTTVSGATVTGTAVQGTTVQGVSGTFTSLTGTTTTGTTANFVSGVFTTRISGTTVTGDTGQFTSGTFVSLTGTTITGTTINAVTVSSTTGTFGSITGTTITGTTINGATVNSTTGNFTSLTGVTVTGTTAQFASGVFITQVSGLTVTGTQSSFTSGNFVTLSGATATFTSGIIASGTAAAPSLSIISDPNTGIYSPGADKVAVATNGTQRLFVDNSGFVVGHTSRLTNYGGTPFVQFNASVGSNFWAGLSLTNWVTGNPAGGTLTLAKSRSGVIGTQGIVSTGDTVGRINFQADDGTNFLQAASIDSLVEGTPAPTSVQGNLRFITTATERLRITSAGLVGIGTSAPTAPLTVIGANNATQAIFGGAFGATGRGLRIATDVLSGNNDIAILDAQSTGGGLLATLVFQTASTERLRIRSDGNIAIGGVGSPSISFYNQKAITGGVTAFANYTSAGVQSDVTTLAVGYRTNLATQDASFTVPSIQHFSASQGTFGASSTVTAQIGFQANGNLSGATTNYGFYGNLSSATGRWNFYANSTAPNYFAGDVRTNTVVTSRTSPSNSNTSATATASSLQDGLRTGTPTGNITLTLPTGTDMDAAFQDLQSNQSFEWSVINLAAATHLITVTAAATGHTVVGNMAVAAANSGRFITRKTAANTFISYRIA